MCLVLAHDITRRLKAQQELQSSEERFRRAIMDAPLPIMIHAENGEILQINHTWTELTGYTHTDIPTISAWTEKAYGEKKDITKEIIEQLYKLNTKIDEGEFTIKIKSGERRIWHFTSSPLGQLPDGRRLVISMAIDVTQRQQMEELLCYETLHDGLTGLPNRRLLEDRLEQSIQKSDYQHNYHFAVLLLDLDRFKNLNDSLGHIMGDRLLILIAEKLQQIVRPFDTVARIGGDEFLILLDDLEEEIDALYIAEEIIENLSQPFFIDHREIFTTVSIGIAFNQGNLESTTDLIRNADIALYRAKEQGRSRYVIFAPQMHLQAQQTLELETNLRLALEREELKVYYQPIVTLDQGKLIGFEALMRWQTEQGFISPNIFIPIAEETGLILSLGEWGLETACRQLAIWQNKYPQYSSLKMSVNISGIQLQNLRIIEFIDHIIRQTGLDFHHLKLEITESILMRHSKTAIDILQQLKDRGIEISIDDFGTGYSSLSYLHHLPIDTLKIDRSFVMGLEKKEDNIKVVETIITLARHLGLKTIAEGVETQDQVIQLQALGCQFGQGYFYSRPLDREGIEQYLQTPPRSMSR